MNILLKIPYKIYDYISTSLRKLTSIKLRNFYVIFGIFSIFTYILLLRIPLLTEHHNFDELMFLSWGSALVEHGPFSLDYTSRFISSSFHSMMYIFAGMDVLVLRLIVSSILVLNALFVFFICYRIYSLRSGIAGSLTFLTYMGLQAFQGTYYTKELFSIFWMSLAVIAGTYRKSFLSTFILGIFVGLGFVSRPLFLMFAAVIFIWQFILLSYPDHIIRFKHAFMYALGFFIPIITEFALTSYYSGSFETYIDQFKRTLAYGTGASSATYFTNLINLVNTQKIFLIPIIIFSLIGLYQVKLFSKKYAVFFLLWLFVCLANISMTGQFFLHYSQVLILPLAILTGFALGDIFSSLYAKKIWLPTFLIILTLGGFSYLGHPYIQDYVSYQKSNITLRDFWKRNGIPDWTEHKNAALYLKKYMKQDDQYFAWTGVPIFYNYLGPSIMPNVVYDVEMLANKYVYMSWKRISYLFNYKLNQRQLIKKIKSKNPPEWISIQTGGARLPQMIKGFPDFFQLVASKYNFVSDLGKDTIFKIKTKEELANSNSGPIPISILVRNYKINSFVFYPDKVSILTSNMNALSENETFVYSGNFSNILENKKNLQISLEEIYDNEQYQDLLNNELGLSIIKAEYDFRKSLPEERINITSAQLPEALLLTTSFNEGISRIFIQTDNIMYEGPDLLGRFPPIYQDINNSELFLFGRDSDLLNSSKVKYIYVVSNNGATIYFNNISFEK